MSLTFISACFMRKASNTIHALVGRVPNYCLVCHIPHSLHLELPKQKCCQNKSQQQPQKREVQNAGEIAWVLFLMLMSPTLLNSYMRDSRHPWNIHPQRHSDDWILNCNIKRDLQLPKRKEVSYGHVPYCK